LKYNDIKIEKFISMVASPGGTTEEGLKSLRRNNYTKIVKESLRVAAKRSSAISKKVASKRKKING
jgi:pyrroline-5-carboxylate reductase